MLGCTSNKCKCDNCPCRQSEDLYSGTVGDIVKQKPEITYNTNRTRSDGKKAPNGIEIRFGTTRPTAEVRDMLKAANFRFSEKQKIWYAIDTAKSRAFAEKLAEMEVDVDNTQYQKKNFWARVKSFKAYEQLRNYTEFYIKVEPPIYYYTKTQLQNKQAVSALIADSLLYFKKYYNEAVGEEEPTNNEPAQTVAANSTDAQTLLELEAEAEIELLRLRVEKKRREKNNLSGIDQDKLKHFRQLAWERTGNEAILNFK